MGNLDQFIKNLTPDQLARRNSFLKEQEQEYPHVANFIATNSGIVEQKPTTQEEWDNYHENLQFVDGAGK